MKKQICICVILFFTLPVMAQYVQKLKTDTVLITNDPCTAELNLENRTKNIQGFLFNKGNGRTEFRKGILKIDSNLFQIGNDTLNLGLTTSGLSTLDGISRLNNNISLGNSIPGGGNHQFNSNRHQYLNGYYYSIGGSARNADSFPVFRFYDNGDFASKTTNQFINPSIYKNGIRFNARLGYLQVGVSSLIDTTVSNMIGEYQTSAIILNTDFRGNIQGQLQNTFVGAYNVQLPAGKTIRYSILSGGSVFLGGNLAHVIEGGGYHSISGNVNGSMISGNGQYITRDDDNSGWFGFNNRNTNGRTNCSLTAGIVNNIGAAAQLTAGAYLTNRSHAAAAIGNANVDFASLPYNSYDSMFTNNTQNIEGRYLLFSLGNSSYKNGQIKSNALSILYNGRTQINTTGFNTSLSESDVTPKAALEVVSNTSGVLLPKLTTLQRDNIANTDLVNGLILYNTDLNKFQYYNGSTWLTIDDNYTITNRAFQTIANSSAINIDLSYGMNAKVTLTGNSTLNIVNVSRGNKGTLIVKQDSTGGRQLTPPANSIIYEGINAYFPLSTLPGAIDILEWVYDGTAFYWKVFRTL